LHPQNKSFILGNKKQGATTMSIKQAILSMPGAIRLTDCTVIPQSRFKEFGICFKRVANYDGDTFRVTITNNGAAPLKIKEVVLFH